MQADRRLQRVVDHLVHVPGREDALRTRRQRAAARRRRRALGQLPSRTVSTPEERAVVVGPAALAGQPAEQPHLVAGAGPQPVVPAVSRRSGPAAPSGRGRRRSRGPARRTRPPWWGARVGRAAGAGRRAGPRRSESLSLFMEAWFLGSWTATGATARRAAGYAVAAAAYAGRGAGRHGAGAGSAAAAERDQPDRYGGGTRGGLGVPGRSRSGRKLGGVNSWQQEQRRAGQLAAPGRQVAVGRVSSLACRQR